MREQVQIDTALAHEGIDMFSKSTQYYDRIYATKLKDYQTESARLLEIVRSRTPRELCSLLDVACGTGVHLQILAPEFDEAHGIDLDPDMVQIAQSKLTECSIHQGNMIDFNLGREFDLVACLFSSIGYVHTIENLNAAIANMARHTAPGGVVIVEPWLSAEQLDPRHLHAVFIDDDDLKLARMSNMRIIDRISRFDFHYLVSTREEGTHHFVEQHDLGLFTVDEHLEAFRLAGLDVEYDEKGLMNRGLYIAVRSA